MELAGYGESRCAMLKNLGMNFDFYLAHGLRDRQHSKEWRIYYPEGLHGS